MAEALGEVDGAARVDVQTGTESTAPKVVLPTRRSMTKSSTAPDTHVTYFACPGGTSEKCTPRRTPVSLTEQFACANDNGWPTASVSRPA